MHSQVGKTDAGEAHPASGMSIVGLEDSRGSKVACVPKLES